MRGKRSSPAKRGSFLGLIPAHAGKTARFGRGDSRYRAQPRACGENLIGLGADLASMGSSPRMRGKPLGVVAACGQSGLIPAHAGKTCQVILLCVSSQAHPRACGENMAPRQPITLIMGSSPRMRGKRRPSRSTRRRRGLIPAHAGKTVEDVRG